MKTKFETNVASEMPKTKSQEPKLPWKLSSDDLKQIELREDEYKAIARDSSPLKTRAFFLILLISCIFAIALYIIINIAMENENMRAGMSESEQKIATLQADLAQVTNEKNILSDNFEQLENQVTNLRAQKELFTAVLESLAEKPD